MSVARWSKEPSETGLRAVVQGIRGYRLKKDGDVIAYVGALASNKNRYEAIGWYWYGLGQNTCRSPVSTAEEAKSQAIAYYKKHGDSK